MPKQTKQVKDNLAVEAKTEVKPELTQEQILEQKANHRKFQVECKMNDILLLCEEKYHLFWKEYTKEKGFTKDIINAEENAGLKVKHSIHSIIPRMQEARHLMAMTLSDEAYEKYYAEFDKLYEEFRWKLTSIKPSIFY
jgi:hypothetical protein